LFIVIGLLVSLLPQKFAQAQSTGLDEVNAQRATVAITQVAQTPNGPVISCTGSGTIVSADGLILTNAHIARGSERCKTDTLVISVIARPGDAPVPTYYADVIQFNTGLDLAVLQIARALDGRALAKTSLSLPFVELGNSDELVLDETLVVIGYPGVDEKNNGSTSVRRGIITNFLDEARSGGRAWIKTSASIPGRMSGGGAFNNAGQLIGIPTLQRDIGGAANTNLQNCRLVQDTNGDGRVDNSDLCVPSGGFVDALRPIALARGLIRAAQLGLTLGATSLTAPPPAATGTPTLRRVFFAPGVNSSGMPTQVITSAPSGTKSLYLFFDYADMRDNTAYELRVTVDGVPNTIFGLSPAVWSGGASGLWYIGAREQIWPNGQYVFTLLLNGTRAASASITLGGEAQPRPEFSDILFGVPSTARPAADGSRPTVITGTILPPRNLIRADFIYKNIPADANWRQVWYNEGAILTQNAESVKWENPGTGKFTATAEVSSGEVLTAGRYRLELYLNEQLAATSDFTIAGEGAGNQVLVFDAPAFAVEKPVTGRARDPNAAGSPEVERVINANTSFPRVPQLYAAFRFRNLQPGTPWTWRLTVDENPLFEGTQPWQADSGSSWFWLRFDAVNTLADGSYELELYVEGVLMAEATVKIGIGQLPVDTFLRATGIQIQGRIVDAETREGIPGVMVIVIKGTVITREFTWDMSEVVELAITDSLGQFQLKRLLPRNETYNMLVVARGYLPLSTDGVELDDTTKNPFILNIELNKD
jgi:S1-C subfamily serine protease